MKWFLWTGYWLKGRNKYIPCWNRQGDQGVDLVVLLWFMVNISGKVVEDRQQTPCNHR